MGSSESTRRRANGGEREEEETDDKPSASLNLGSAAEAIGTAAAALETAAVLTRGASRMLSDDKWRDVIHEMRSLGLEHLGVPPRRFKLNTDAACHPNHLDAGIHPDDDVLRGPSGYAGILEDDRGNLVRGFRGFIGVTDSFTAEIHGILKGLELLGRLGYKGCILENDSEAAVDWVTREGDGPGKSRVVCECWDLIKKSRKLVRKNNITVRCCSRNANKRADKLAGIAIKKGEAYVEFTDVYREINGLD